MKINNKNINELKEINNSILMIGGEKEKDIKTTRLAYLFIYFIRTSIFIYFCR